MRIIIHSNIPVMLTITDALSLANPQLLTALTSINDCLVEFSVVVVSVLNTC
jgi:hypothetical protein